MTILFITHYSGFYGASKSLLSLMADLRERYGVTPLVLLPHYGEFCDKLEERKIEYKVTHYYWWVNDNKGLFQWLLNKRKQIINYTRINKIGKIFSDKKIDLVYSNSVTVNMGIFIAEKLKVPHIWHFRESLSQFNLSLSLSLSLSLLRKAVNKKYILISDYMVNYYTQYLPMDRVVKIYNGIKIPSNIRQENKVNNGILNFCMVGVLCEQKNQMETLRAVNRLKEKGYNGFCLHLIGSHKSEYLNLINQFIEKNTLQDFVKIWGHRADIDDLLEQMNVGLMCSRDEAFGRVTIEYMMHRMPVIASISGANAELVKDGENGFLYPIGEDEKLADFMTKFLFDAELLNEMGTKSYESVINTFTVEKNTDAIFKQIQDVIKT